MEKRTLTNLYNEHPAWLDLAHEKLDAAVTDGKLTQAEADAVQKALDAGIVELRGRGR